ncbi:hypothetical protein [Iodobacter ciconiae]|uniref:Lipoprotein n=1 Tax=Iodobacter ciconiae TaxID=2496266 RepID=A0A3S8ZWU1_9NEIS|nr:hypothetical protein [Iodobacter ciconiae]AZN37987.1 hypothetical protein EJO50_16845 [Iodobacter ciconiae]
MNIRQIILLAFSVFLSTLSGCAPSPEPKPPLSTPIKFDKAGQKAFIDFWATPSDSSERNVLMLGVSFVGKNTDVDTDIFRDITPLVKIKVTRLSGAASDGIHLSYYSASSSDDEIATGTSTRWITAYGDYFAHHDYYLASIDRKNSGLFRAEIEVLQDNPAFNNLDFNFTVAYRLYYGK